MDENQSPHAQLQRLVYELFYNHLRNHEPGQEPKNLHEQCINCVEEPLFNATVAYTQGNLTKAASILGISRSTLSRKTKNSEKKTS